jgi:PAS domain S-box-containing protein
MPFLFSSRNSIRQRLTFSICLQLLTVMLIFGGISYIGARKIALKLGEDRLKTLSNQLGTMIAGNAHTLLSATYSVANRPAIKKYLLSNGKDSAGETMKLLESLRSDTLFVLVELKNSKGVTVINPAGRQAHLNINIDSLVTSTEKDDSGRVEKLFASGNSIYYPIIVTISENRQLIGYIVRWKRVVYTPGALEQLSRLMGTGASIFVGNSDGSLWTDLLKPIPSPLVNNPGKDQIIEYTSSKRNSVIASVCPVGNSKWLIAVELSRKKVFETANRFLYWLIIAGCLLLIVGFFIAWLTSRNISKPIKNLTMANSLLAAGNYSSILDLNRRDELGRLAKEFHAMAIQVQHSREELEKRAQNYKLLFERNPMPMWIISEETLDVMDVNDAAVDHYGYSREEFLQLNSRDLRPKEDIEKYMNSIDKRVKREYRGIWRHKRKDGAVIMVDVIADSIIYQEKPARLILSNDVTEKLNAEAELVSHRIMQQKLMTEAAIQVQEKEREEIGKELHDNINQILASTKLYLELALGGNLETLGDAISKSYQNVTFIIEEIRRLTKKLVPPSLDTTLEEAIRDLIDEIQAIAPVKISLVIELDEKSLNENIKLMIYRIVQEQINNILKHAAASQVEIRIGSDKEKLDLVISDNGVGFDTNKKPKGIGLRNIDNRVKFYNGITHVTSCPGKGCSLEISIPLQKIMNPLS